MKSNKKILISGDVYLDNLIHSESDGKLTFANNTVLYGGAFIVFDILKSIYGEEQIVDINIDLECLKNYKCENKTFFLLKKFIKKDDISVKVWRIAEPLGFGIANDSQTFEYDIISKYENNKYELVIIDDEGGSYRKTTNSKAWPISSIMESSIVLYKISSPIGQGDLFRTLTINFSKNLIALISVDDIRKENILISKGISWEKTIWDLIFSFRNNFQMKKILQSKYVLIRLGVEGLLLLETKEQKIFKIKLIFDPLFLEGEWSEKLNGTVYGGNAILLAILAKEIVTETFIERESDPTNEGFLNMLVKGVKEGLITHKSFFINGFTVKDNNIFSPFVNLLSVNKKKEEEENNYQIVDIPTDINEDWNFINTSKEGVNYPLYGSAKLICLFGVEKALPNIPHASFGKLFTIDRNEMEGYRSIKNTFSQYRDTYIGQKPLSIAVFGAPGAGKSFGVKEIAKGILGNDVPIIEFNLSQFRDSSDLIGAYHQIRDKVLTGKTPVVFWDEFDSKDYFWLQYFLSPMQDGSFLDGQIIHPIGKCIFIFAGATSFEFKTFGPDIKDVERQKDFKLKKGPDFISRLNAYLNVLGPNKRIIKNIIEVNKDDTDIFFPIRRAILIRSLFGKMKKEILDIDRGLLSALIEIDEYKHGARSLEKLISYLSKSQSKISRSQLPVDHILDLYVDSKKFIKILEKNLFYEAFANEIAPEIHKHYRKLGNDEGWIKSELDNEYEDLTDELKEDNIISAIRIPEILSLIGLQIEEVKDGNSITIDKAVKALMEENIEILAEEEHIGWMQQKYLNGWRLGPKNNDMKTHPCLVNYQSLSDEEKNKDRNQVRHYQTFILNSGFKIIRIS